ncbi:lytic murein transglycosylase [uncultured Roseibium sp.]|uniref:lytic murein transglycosylase n=1 Tax=uncultured Roseibium sp. TaxID=1936171 RepID=UPI003217E96C
MQHGDLDPRGTTGAWAGEIGQVQMLPADIIRFGVDGDRDGHVNVKASSADAILTGANFIQHLGWKRGEPWLQEVSLPGNFSMGNDRARSAQERQRVGQHGREAASGLDCERARRGDPAPRRRDLLSWPIGTSTSIWNGTSPSSTRRPPPIWRPAWAVRRSITRGNPDPGWTTRR